MKSPNIRSLLAGNLQGISEERVGLLLSGGVGSTALLFSLLTLGKRVTAYTFTMEGHVSSDFSRARRTAALFRLEFVPIFLPRDVDGLKRDMLELATSGVVKKKTDFECGWPMLHAYREVAEREKVLVAGMGDDCHFCLSKKGLLHYAFNGRIDEFRKKLYANAGYAQRPLHEMLAERYGLALFLPYLTPEMKAAFLGTTWEQVNKPKQKQPVLDAFPEGFKRVKPYPHINLQLGDSGIATHCASLLKTDWNQRGAKSVVTIYNDLVARRITHV